MSDEPVTIELNPRERRLYDRLRDQVVRFEPGTSSGLRDVMLLFPDLVVLLMRLLRDRRVAPSEKAIALVGVGYVLSPLDLLPGLLLGPIGLVDDALVVSACLSRILNHVHPDVVRSQWSGKGDALDAIQRVSAWSEGFFASPLRSFLRGVFRPEIGRRP